MTREEINKDKQNEIFKAENKEKTKKIIEKFVKTTIFITKKTDFRVCLFLYFFYKYRAASTVILLIRMEGCYERKEKGRKIQTKSPAVSDVSSGSFVPADQQLYPHGGTDRCIQTV